MHHSITKMTLSCAHLWCSFLEYVFTDRENSHQKWVIPTYIQSLLYARSHSIAPNNPMRKWSQVVWCGVKVTRPFDPLRVRVESTPHYNILSISSILNILNTLNMLNMLALACNCGARPIFVPHRPQNALVYFSWTAPTVLGGGNKWRKSIAAKGLW